MEFIGWMYDIAREQSPREDVLAEMLVRSAAAGYNAVGLYLEHRFAYKSAPWASGPGCLTPEVVRRVAAGCRPAGVRLIPFLNTLGHMEGFIRSEGGQWLAEGEAGFGGEQMCATRPECAALARDLVADAIEAFDDEWVHLGGDETRQLGQCPLCAERVARIGKGGLYGEYFGPLCRFVLDRGRRPCLWGDMLIQHPEALDAIPRETVIFDWQYTSRPRDSTRMFRTRGFDVVCCPSVQSYNSGWCFLSQTQRNIDEHAEDARAAGALGVLVTTWEYSYFTQYATMLPVVYAAGRRLARGDEWAAALAGEGGESYARAAELLGNRIPAAATLLAPGTWRQLRDCFVIRQNPFYLWQNWRTEACGPAGDEILSLCDEADAALRTPALGDTPPACRSTDQTTDQRSVPQVPLLGVPGEEEPLRGAVMLHRVAVRWVRLVERAYGAYAAGHLSDCVRELEGGITLLESLRPSLEHAVSVGGSTADLRRLDVLLEKVERACARIRELAAGSIHRPAFAILTHDGFVSGDQTAWRTGAYR